MSLCWKGKRKKIISHRLRYSAKNRSWKSFVNVIGDFKETNSSPAAIATYQNRLLQSGNTSSSFPSSPNLNTQRYFTSTQRKLSLQTFCDQYNSFVKETQMSSANIQPATLKAVQVTLMRGASEAISIRSAGALAEVDATSNRWIIRENSFLTETSATAVADKFSTKNKFESMSILTQTEHDRAEATDASPIDGNYAAEYGPKSSLGFCENCCETMKTGSTIQPQSAASKVNRTISYSVSEVPFSRSESIDLSAYSVNTSTFHPLSTSVSASASISLTPHSLSPSLALTSSSPAICCYTFSKHANSFAATNNHRRHIYTTQARTSSINDEANCSGNSCLSIQGKFGKNHKYDRSSSIPIKTLRRKVSPPPVPPKPNQNHSKNGNCPSENNGNKSFRSGVRVEKSSYDPTSFRRKIQKFEKQHTLIRKSKNIATSSSAVAHNKDDDDRCEFLNCFSVGKNIHSDQCISNASLCFCTVRSVSNIVDEQEECDAGTHTTAVHLVRNESISNKNNSKNNNNNNAKVVNREKSQLVNVHIVNDDASEELNDALNRDSKSSAKRTLRYDSCGRLKSIGVEDGPTPAGHDSISGSRFNHAILEHTPAVIANSVVVRKLTPKHCRKLNIDGGDRVVQLTSNVLEATCCDSSEESLILPHRSATDLQVKIAADVHHLPVTAGAAVPNFADDAIDDDSQDIGFIGCSYSTSAFSFGPDVVVSKNNRNHHSTQSDLDFSCSVIQKQLLRDATAASVSVDDAVTANAQVKTKIFKSLSDTSNVEGFGLSADFRSLKSKRIIANSDLQSASATHVHRSLSDIELKNEPSCFRERRHNICECECANRNRDAIEIISNNSCKSYQWLSSETIEENSSRSELSVNIIHTCNKDSVEQYQRALEDFSNSSNHSNLAFADTDCLSIQSTSSSPSLGSCLLASHKSTGLILKRIPAIQSFGYTQLQSSSNVRELEDKETIMEKRRNTLDRFQRLGFGRKSSLSPSNQERNRKSSEKSERLKELTELLRGNRSSPTPPPVPPPRKPRNLSKSASSSFDKPEKQLDGTPLSMLSTHSDDIMLMDHEEEDIIDNLPSDLSRNANFPEVLLDIGTSNSCQNTPKNRRLYETLKPNTSIANFESLISREESKSPPPAAYQESSGISTKLSRPESRTVIGSYTQKGIPFRSASFSQIDYASGKYKKSALSALRDRLRRDKALDSSSSVVINSHLTMPRTKDEMQTGMKKNYDEEKIEPDFIYIPLKRIDLNVTLDSDEAKLKSLEDILEPSSLIPEKDAITAGFLQDHVKKEFDVDEQNTPATVEEKPLDLQGISNLLKLEETDIFESNLATLVEEEIPMESPLDNILQTATTCLIPVPVYECAAQEWRLENPPHEWVEVAPDEIGIIPHAIEPVMATNLFGDDNKTDESVEPAIRDDQKHDSVPTISVSRMADNIQELTFPTCEKHEQGQDTLKFTKQSEKQSSVDYPEVKKRYSHDDMEIGTEKRSSLDCITSRFGTSDEKKRIDKSKRRKGMYIESPEWTGMQNTEGRPSNRGLELDISIANFNALKTESPEDASVMPLSSPATDDTKTPGSIFSFDLNTPESECSRPPVWSNTRRRTSLSCQSSEEKDDLPFMPQKSNKTNPYLRTDSISDNEIDRTPPSSRDRTSPSPALSDQDFKRYSKRPLRGPYGQMLEAEMKKPNKMHFEEILEELKDSECLSVRRERADHGNRFLDEPARSLPQYSNSVRVRKPNAYLPIPSHIRAASTPSQIENIKMDKINPLEKRYQSTLDNSMSLRDKDFNKFPHEGGHHHREVKRAASEAPMAKPLHSKRSISMAGDKHQHYHRNHNHHQEQKPSIEEIRISQSSRTPSDRNMLLDASTKNSTGSELMPTPELLAELLKGSSEKLLSEQREQMFADTRTHVVQEIFRNEQSYVESLQTVVVKYFKVLKTPEHAGMIDSRTVDEIFFMVPDILEIHEKFLNELKSRLDFWEPKKKVGDAFIETFSKTEVLEVYTSFVNNCNRAKNAIRTTKTARPSFARFLEATAREHKGKLTLDNLLIKPVQKFPNYEMLFTRLIKHTDNEHPDQKHLQEVLKLVHDILVHINCKEREILENGQREATLRELEGVIEGVTDLIASDRQFLIFELVTMPSGQGARKERGFFLFNDLLVITSIKRRSGTIRKPNATLCPSTVASALDTNKYKFLTKVSLDNLEIVKTKDENLKKIMNEIEQLADDCNKLQQIAEVAASLKYPHQVLEDVIRDLHRDVQRQLSERQSNDAQLNMLELTVNSPSGSQKLSIVFSKAEKRSQWEETFNEAKQKLAATLERHPIPEFLTSIPIRKTRAGLQFTCAAPTLSEQPDVWVCNSDGYVGQVCIMSLQPEPNVTSCNGVCNARILCVASVPAYNHGDNAISHRTLLTEDITRVIRKSNAPNCQASHVEKKKASTTMITTGNSNIQLDSNSSSDDSEAEVCLHKERVPSPAPSSVTTQTAYSTHYHHQHQDSNPDECDGNQSTMWLGTEDGCIHVYNSTDNIRIKKNKIKIQHSSAVYSILYLDNRVFVSLANGDICVYLRDSVGWNTNSSHCIPIGTVSSPVSKLLNVHGKLWCSIQGIIKVLDIETLQVVNQIQISSDSKPITNMAVSNSYVWISIQNSAHIKCFHSISHQLINEVNLAPAVNKMLSNCDEIIRQHKAACLRVTSISSCKDLIWIGTSAGVLLTIPAQGYEKGNGNVVPTGIPHGHTGHVRFLTFVETISETKNCQPAPKENDASTEYKNKRSTQLNSKNTSETSGVLIISGGDGYEDFRNSGVNSLSEIAGREDSTNHLLIWQI